MSLADMLLLKPPPFGCDGGWSSVVPFTVVVPPPLSETTTCPEVRGRRSAVPEGSGNVVRSIMRKRSRKMSKPVVLVKRRRTEIVPNVELFGGSEVKSRTRLGDALAATPGSISPTLSAGPALRWPGLLWPSGPGAPSRCPPPALVPLVSTNTKSAALLFVSCESPAPAPVDGTLRYQL